MLRRSLITLSTLSIASYSLTQYQFQPRRIHCDVIPQPTPPPLSPNQLSEKERERRDAIAAAKRYSSPIFQGTPVAATLLMHQAVKIFDPQFNDLLEMSPVFVLPENVPDRGAYSNGNAPDDSDESDMVKEFGYNETGGFLGSWASGVEVKVPVFEKLTQTEESRLGNAGIRKKPVGALVMKGKCSYGCAVVQLMHLQVLKLDGTVVWEKDTSKSMAAASARR
ncbi:UNVERIFIED_CONTAM: hypothetical protein HDU68_009620 [Siphonaria sp. JEL0065]|nr:hypothetical protein HDU68_009620 [Siphonaria sp. JEL0065]